MSSASAPIPNPGAIPGGESPLPAEGAHEAEARFRSLAEACLDHVILLDRNLRVVSVNRTQAGTSPESMIGVPLADLAEPEEREAVIAILDRVLRTGETVRYECRHRRHDGSWALFDCVAHRAERSGDVVGLTVTGRDITEQRREAQELERSRGRFKALQQLAHIGIWEWDVRTGRVEWSEEVYQIFGIKPCQPSYELARAHVHPDDLEFWQTSVQAALAGERRLDIDYRALRADGTVIWVHNETEVIRDERGNPLVMFGSVQDVTERRQTQEALHGVRAELETRVQERTAALQAANRRLAEDIEARKTAEREKARMEAQLRHSQALEAVGRLAGGVAHDFNNLLGAVLACAWAAQLPDAAPEQVRIELGRIQDLCKQGAQVTGQLLAVARQTPTSPTVLDLARELEQIRVLVERACPMTVAVGFDIGEGLPPIAADRALLTTALLNLCLNARDAMPRGGTLTVCARAEAKDGQDWAIVTVTDTGAGIPPELQDRVFQPFFSTKLKGRGVGLGLPMAFAMAQDAGGLLELESQLGQGATFTLSLPGARQTGQILPTDAGAAEEAQDGRGDGGAILVVEDEEDIGRMIVEILARNGCRALRARTGLEALEMVRDRADEVRLILLDLMLPHLSGASVHQVLKATVPQIPVVFVTGREDLATEVDASLPRLRKPFSAEELLACVRKSLGCVDRFPERNRSD